MKLALVHLTITLSLIFVTVAAMGQTSNSTLLLVYNASNLLPSESNFELVSRFYGVKLDVKMLSALTPSDIMDDLGRNYLCVVLSSLVLESLDSTSVNLLMDYADKGGNIFVQDVLTGLPHVNLFQLTGGQVAGARFQGEPRRNLIFSSGFPQMTGVFTGLRFSNSASGLDDALLFNDTLHVKKILGSLDSTGQYFCFYAQCQAGDGNIYVCSVMDDYKYGALQQCFNVQLGARILPSMMLLKYLYGNGIWHSQYSFANLTIDDVYFSVNSGIDFSALLAEMKAHNFRTTIAYIPNHYIVGLDDPAVEQLVKANSDYFSIVQHGDNHYTYEFFAYTSFDSALACAFSSVLCGYSPVPYQKQEVAVAEGMAKLRSLEAKIDFSSSQVMVFPYSICPAPTLNLLTKYGFNATSNEAAAPLLAPPDTSFDAWMRPANANYNSFPLLQRFHPYLNDTIHAVSRFPDAVFNLFIGKPALFYTHDGQLFPPINGFDNFADSLNGITSPPTWASLDYIASRLYLAKANEDGSDSVWVFSASTVHILNDSSISRVFHLFKSENSALKLQSISVAGQPVPFSLVNGYAYATITIPQKTEVMVKFSHAIPNYNFHVSRSSDVKWFSDSVRVQIHNLCDSSAVGIVQIVDSVSLGYDAVESAFLNANDSAWLSFKSPMKGEKVWMLVDPFNALPTTDTVNNDFNVNVVANDSGQGQEQEANSFRLFQNYPNPFNPTTEIKYEMAGAGKVTLVIFNVIGQKVRALASNVAMQEGSHYFLWRGDNDSGCLVGSGVYYYQLTVTSEGRETYSATKKMLLLR
jgi:hypothetical protein